MFDFFNDFVLSHPFLVMFAFIFTTSITFAFLLVRYPSSFRRGVLHVAQVVLSLAFVTLCFSPLNSFDTPTGITGKWDYLANGYSINEPILEEYRDLSGIKTMIPNGQTKVIGYIYCSEKGVKVSPTVCHNKLVKMDSTQLVSSITKN